MRSLQNIDGFFWRCLKWANAALLLLLFGLAACCYCLYTGKTVPVPELLVEAVERELAANGVAVECGSMRLGADFSIVAEDIVLREHDKGREFFSAKRVCAGLSLRFLFGGKIPIRHLSVSGGSVLGGGGAPIFSDIYLLARFGRSAHSLDFLRARFFNAEIAARGKVENNCSLADLERLFEVASKKLAPKDSSAPVGVAARGAGLQAQINGAASAGKWLEKFSSPSVEIDFGLLSGGSNFINIGVASDAAKYEGGKFSLLAEGLKASLSYANTNTRERILITASAGSVNCGSHKSSARSLLFRSGVHVGESDIALFDVDFSAAEAVYDGTSAGRVCLSNKMISPDSFGDGWRFFVLRGGDRLRGNFDFSLDGVFSCEFSGNVNPGVILKRKELADIPEMEDFDFPSGVYLSGSASYGGAGAPFAAEVSVEASTCKIMRLDIDCATAVAEFEGGVLRCRDIVAKTVEGWGARGSYTQDFNTNAYEIEVKGSIRPMAISHFMEPWWGRIMGAFSFGKGVPMPRADIRVEGVWGFPERIWCFGSVEGVGAVYKGSKFDSFSMLVWVNPSRITLYDIEMAAGHGAREGRCFVEWLYGASGITSYESQRLFLRSGLSPSELISLGGAEAKEIFDVVKFANPPQLSLNALMFNPANNPNRRRDLFNAEVRGNGDVSVEMITLQNPHFFARSDKIDTDIFGATFVFCGGDGNGDFHVKHAAGTAFIEGMASALKMNQGLFFDFLESLGGSEEEGGESPLGGGGSGEVSAGLKLRGDVKNMANSVGGGYVEINSKDFLKLNIFGGISKAFASIGVPMGSFDITKVKTDFDIGGGELKLSPVEFEGPTMRIIGASVYSFKDGMLRGELKAYPFDKMENRVVAVVNKIVNPIMDAVRVKVSGTLANPEFSAKITPVDIITDEKKLIEKIDESL